MAQWEGDGVRLVVLMSPLSPNITPGKIITLRNARTPQQNKMDLLPGWGSGIRHCSDT